MVRATPDLDAIYVVNPGDYSICEELAKVDMQKRIRIITNDIVSRQMYLIDKGVIGATIGQQPENRGMLSMNSGGKLCAEQGVK